MNTHRLDDGFSTIISLENIPTVRIFEKEVTPPAFQNGGPIETTTMRNTAWRTKAPKQLKTLGTVSATVAYATAAFDDIQAQLGINQQVTVTFPDQSTMTFWGWLDEFTPGSNKEGDQPTATITVQPSNRDNAGAEQAPVYAPSTDSDESA